MISHLGVTCRGWAWGSTGGWCFQTWAAFCRGWAWGSTGGQFFLLMPLCVSHSWVLTCRWTMSPTNGLSWTLTTRPIRKPSMITSDGRATLGARSSTRAKSSSDGSACGMDVASTNCSCPSACDWPIYRLADQMTEECKTCCEKLLHLLSVLLVNGWWCDIEGGFSPQVLPPLSPCYAGIVMMDSCPAIQGDKDEKK